ncbi:MAG: acyl-ACP--UDP-N-acetylglucosamine O-acyltransferase, partial [Verrucomicrobiota bacterium]|nr:acyl-ACP--UDP-N-acetylglucosamine O-acyltransferase [Verrucomicrobiota bacterium]
VGEGSVIQPHVVLEGTVRIGKRNLVGCGSVLGGLPQDLAFNPETASGVDIGDRNVIREHCTIHRGTALASATEIGDDNFLMAGVHVGHDCRVANGVIIANNCLLGGHVQIDDGAFIGGGTTFHQFVHVGRLVMAQGSSGFGKDIPPFLLAAERNFVFGVNVPGLKRAGFTAAEREEIRRAFKLLYRSGLNRKQALEQAAATEFGPLGREFFEFVANARKRGIVPYRYAGEL